MAAPNLEDKALWDDSEVFNCDTIKAVFLIKKYGTTKHFFKNNKYILINLFYF